MRKALIPLVFVAMSACSKVEQSPTVEAQAETPPVAIEEPTPEPEKPKPVEKPAPKIAAATPEPKQYAPEGIFFLKQAVNVENDAGIIGVKRGTQLAKVGDKYRTPAGDELALTADQVTNELGEIRAILEQEHASAASVAQWKAQASAAEQAQQQARLQAATPQPVASAPIAPVYTPPATTPKPAASSSSLNSSAYGKTDYGDKYNAKQAENRRKGMR